MLSCWVGGAHERTIKLDALLGFVAASNIDFEGGGEHERFLIWIRFRHGVLLPALIGTESVQFYCPPPDLCEYEAQHHKLLPPASGGE